MWTDGAFHIHAGFGIGGRVAADAVAADLWRWDGGWRLLAEDGPPPVRYPSLCTDGASGFYRFGGCGMDGQTLSFSAELWHWAKVWTPVATGRNGPAARYTSALVRDGDRLLMFGGNSQTPAREKFFYGDLWIFEAGAWHRVHGEETGPGPLYGFGWVRHEGGLHVFGGFDGSRDSHEHWRLDLKALTWERLGEGPPARYCPALGVAGGNLVLFGGRSKTNPRLNFADTWIFDGNWRRYDGNGPGYHAKPGYASGPDGLWVFGGEGPVGHVSDTWCFDGKTWHCIEQARDDDPVLW